jgi:protein TonB
LQTVAGSLLNGDFFFFFQRLDQAHIRVVAVAYPLAVRAKPAGVVSTLRVLENGKVGQVMIEKTAGHPDLDRAAAEAVKKWLFEPARRGKEPVSVWVLLPVQFQLNH